MGEAQTDSHYKRLQRFFRKFELNYYEIAKVIVGLMNIPEPWVLSLDRTDWQFGQTTFNILTLGIVPVRSCISHSVVDARARRETPTPTSFLELLEEVTTVFPERKIAYLTADREFLGHDWFGYLLKQPTLPFRIRIRASDCLSDGRQRLKASVVFSHLLPQQAQILPKRRRLWGYWLYVAALRLENNDLLIVVTPHSPETAIADYASRWGIETLRTHFQDSWILFGIYPLHRFRTLEQTFSAINYSTVLGISDRTMVASNQAAQT